MQVCGEFSLTWEGWWWNQSTRTWFYLQVYKWKKVIFILLRWDLFRIGHVTSVLVFLTLSSLTTPCTHWVLLFHPLPRASGSPNSLRSPCLRSWSRFEMLAASQFLWTFHPMNISYCYVTNVFYWVQMRWLGTGQGQMKNWMLTLSSTTHIHCSTHTMTEHHHTTSTRLDCSSKTQRSMDSCC